MPLLKSLELHGYKTFASRTIFEFPGQVTAIVGPNGSGKSNIADAVRWVLGEQSYSLLRGRKTEDMIFSGSELRPRAGMASASIVFDNESGWLPIDYSEVSITRRAYRDGTNEYLLNGQRVRLKEITELLAQSGLAERTYTIIGQGLVDAALSLKPEERRRFFEEAAGIGLYRARREEALNRLDATRRNLERVQDILSELEPRLQSLERQAKRAMEYEQIRNDLRMLLRDWYGYHWQRSQAELIHAREALRVQEERLEQARQRQTEAEDAVNKVREQQQELRERLNTWHRQSAEFHTQREKISRALAVMEERQRSLTEQRRSAQSDLARLEEERAARQARHGDLAEEVERLRTELAESAEQLERARQALAKRQAERGELEGKLREARRALVNAETHQVQWKARSDELANRLESLQASLRGLEQTMALEGEDRKRLQARLEQWELNRKGAEEELHKAEGELNTHREALRKLEEQRRAMLEERGKLEAERERYKAQLEVLEQAERSLSGLASGTRFLLQEAQQGRVKGRFQALIGGLVVPAELEHSIAAALGEALDCLLMDASDHLDEVLEVLERAEKGRAVIVPVAEAHVREELGQIMDEGCLGIAADLVQVVDAWKPAIKVLLGHVLVARDRQSARRILVQLPDWARVVTLTGEVFLGNGVVIAGREGKPNHLISRPRRLQELRESVEVVSLRLETLNDQLRTVENQVADLRSREKELENMARQAQGALSKASQGYQQAVLENEQARQKQEYQARQANALRGQIERAEGERQQAAKELETGALRVQALNEQVRELNRTLNGLPLEELQSTVNHWSTAQAVTTRAVRDAEKRLIELTEGLTGIQNQIETLKQRLEESRIGLEQLDSERRQALSEEEVLNRQIEELREQIEPAELQLRAVQEEGARLQDNLIAAQQAVTLTERYTTQAQLEATRCRDSLEALRRKIEEDFGLVAFEYSGDVSGPTPLPLEGMVEQLPAIAEIPADLEENISRQRALLRRMGPINPEVQHEYRSVKERYEFLTGQVVDLQKADADLRQVITELDELMRRDFHKTFDAVAAEFRQMFTRLFGGGSARLILNDAESTAEMGIDIEARLPGRRDQGLSLLSGGERSLTAVALIFSLLKVSPTPFCVMDEVDAMLDEANVGRFRDLLRELSEKTQFIIVSHNRNTVQAADVIYGVTMGRDSASQVISLRLDELSDEMVQ